ncbi:Dipeptidyl aminopeptidase/acylaminoacyl peptidase [Tangfeifania diversioriginum]|uniref:Dipeptidyl aminopeptidase/acylaminoacyl peptidase n=1 Tax=Tangfeifania diversioriginum TaxID=1168035 RepID=A0A1M6AWH3_9BACT|nr:prolyl oligopeptidase family serine peptidase [Tangfeifania diversioriginum]SHI40797.1 Dipeptidyl aminopeptidase/acylaminoacyl peptidase [Tangfeifania diversioriginum]
MKNLLFLFLLLIPFTSFSQIQKNNQSPLTIGQIMQEPGKWVGSLPENIYWGEQGEKIYFDWNPEQDTLSSLYRYSLKDEKIEKVLLDEKKNLPGRRGSYNDGETRKVYTRNGNLFLYDVKKTTERQLTNWLENAYSPDFALDESHISFMKNNNLFLLNLETGVIEQVTNFVQGEEKPDSENKGQAKWLENQQKELFDVLNEREAENKAQENRREEEEIETPEKIYLGKSRLADATLSPSGDYVIYSTYDRPENSKSTGVAHFITEDGYTREQDARPKVGSPETRATIGIYDVENNKTIEVQTSAIPGLKDLPDFLSDYPDQIPEDTADIKEREFNLVGSQWHDEKNLAVVVALSLDNKDRWIMLLDPENGEMELLDRQRDEAWIAGPGIGGYSISAGEMGWMPDGKSVWFHSEESGYSHLYSVNIETKEKKALTSGKFEVSNASISNDKKHFYFTANKVHPGVKHFYKIPVEGGELTQITSMEGHNEVSLSPDEKLLAIRYSYANQPWELYLQKNKAGAEAERITHSTTEEFERYDWRVPEFITFEAEDGAEIHARLYRPENPGNNGPAVIFVHGAGYLQNAHKWWSSYSREYQFHNFLVDNGYTVLDIDYRGSAGYGRDWRTGIYRHMGGKDLSDHVDGAKMLVEKYDVSPEKIGIYGGSYGGFITLMAMFTEPEVFAAGAALRSVTDWAHYNHGYTSNILNTPVDDSLAYVRSSPIYFADGLQGALLMCHGMVDDNVQFQDIVRLSQRLIELGKENWELAVYPVEPHGFRDPSSWTDEYKRIFKLFEETLKE